MLLAELNIRHTRRHMPTRRVAVDDGYLPTSGPAFGGVLIGAVLAECVPGLDEEQVDALARLVDVAKRGNLTVPRIALRYRLQRDTHGLDLSRHRITSAAIERGSGASLILHTRQVGRGTRHDDPLRRPQCRRPTLQPKISRRFFLTTRRLQHGWSKNTNGPG